LFADAGLEVSFHSFFFFFFFSCFYPLDTYFMLWWCLSDYMDHTTTELHTLKKLPYFQCLWFRLVKHIAFYSEERQM